MGQDNSLFQKAVDAVNRFTNMSAGGGGTSEQDKQAAQSAIQAAYDHCTPEEKQQLQQLEQKLEQNQLT